MSNSINALIICENRQEVEDLLPIARSLPQVCSGPCQVTLLHTDQFHLQNVTASIEQHGVENAIELQNLHPIDKPLHLNSYFTKLAVVLKNRQQIESIAEPFNVMLCGVDGAIQRVFMHYIARNGGYSGIVIHGILSRAEKRSTRTQLRLAMKSVQRRLVRALGMSYLEMGSLGQADANGFFVAGETTKNTLADQGVPADRIHVVGLPRFSPLFQNAGPRPVDVPKFRVLFLPGAWKWAGDVDEHAAQQRMTRLIFETIIKLDAELDTEVQLVIKLHPRESAEDYAWLADKRQVEITSGDLRHSIESSDLVVSVASTALFEALAVQRLIVRPTFSTTIDFVIEDLVETPTVAEFENLLSTLIQDRSAYDELLRQSTEVLHRYMDPNTPHAAASIATIIRDAVTGTTIDDAIKATANAEDVGTGQTRAESAEPLQESIG